MAVGVSASQRLAQAGRHAVVVLLAVGWLLLASSLGAGERSPLWAQPLAGTTIKNFYQIDARLYRAAQPETVGFAALKERGIVTVLNLRDNHRDDDAARGLGFDLQRVAMEADEITVDQLVQALRVIRQAQGPVLIHCWHGSDRTGAVSAAYRIVLQGWDKEAAIEELVQGGYGFHAIYGNIPKLLRSLDVPAVRQAVSSP